MNPVVYTVVIQHWDDGDVDATVSDVGDSEEDRKSVAHALRKAADLVEHGKPVHRENYS
jgi:hypothetical protein